MRILLELEENSHWGVRTFFRLNLRNFLSFSASMSTENAGTITSSIIAHQSVHLRLRGPLIAVMSRKHSEVNSWGICHTSAVRGVASERILAYIPVSVAVP